MIRAKELLDDYKKYKHIRKHLLFRPEDRPVVVQFCSNKANEIVGAAKLIEKYCDAIDVNLGCPQASAQRDNFGAFLLDQPNIVQSMLTQLVQHCNVPIFAKIRILATFEETLDFIKLLQNCGVSLITIHGRRRERIHHKGSAKLNVIKRIREWSGIRVPIISNGNIRTFDDCIKNMQYTNCEGVMSACQVLKDPTLFKDSLTVGNNINNNSINNNNDNINKSGKKKRNKTKNKNKKKNVSDDDPFAICYEYLHFVSIYGVCTFKSINDHIAAFLKDLCFYPLDDENDNVYYSKSKYDINGKKKRRNVANSDVQRLLFQFGSVNTMNQIYAILNILEVRCNRKYGIELYLDHSEGVAGWSLTDNAHTHNCNENKKKGKHQVHKGRARLMRRADACTFRSKKKVLEMQIKRGQIAKKDIIKIYRICDIKKNKIPMDPRAKYLGPLGKKIDKKIPQKLFDIFATCHEKSDSSDSD